jgi:hypothetical protein
LSPVSLLQIPDGTSSPLLFLEASPLKLSYSVAYSWPCLFVNGNLRKLQFLYLPHKFDSQVYFHPVNSKHKSALKWCRMIALKWLNTINSVREIHKTTGYKGDENT